MSASPIRSVLVVGGGTAGWMAAAALARAFGGRVEVEVLEIAAEADSGSLGVAESSLPALVAFHRLIGLDEDALVRRGVATFKLGERFTGWSGAGSTYVHPYSEFGATLDGVGFHQLWLKARRAGAGEDLDAYALGAVAAGLGRFARPDGDPRSVLSTMAYGLHLDVAAYAAELRALAACCGARRTEGALAAVDRRADGRVEAINLSDGRRLCADLYIDATGDAARVCGDGAFEDWSGWLPCDRIESQVTSTDATPAPLTEATALPCGWRLDIPLLGRTASITVQPSRFAPAAGGRAFRQGARAEPWRGNCVAIGLAACVLEPLDGAALHIVQSGVTKLIGLFPDLSFKGGESTEYNRLMAEELARLRDFAIAHYRLNGRLGEPFWDAARAASPPPPLAHKLRLFESRGRVVLNDEETFLEPSWIALFLGQGLTPRRYHPMADQFPLPKLQARLAQVRAVMRQAAEAMPPHAQVLARLGARP